MYDDLLGPKKKAPKKKPDRIKWDLSEYEEKAYCYNCGSEDFTVVDDRLKSDRMEKDILCNDCGCEWKEVWNKDIELELEELEELVINV